jgi:hypothetical protein
LAIPDSQLETWSHQGSVSQSCDTYATIKSVLEDSASPYYLKSFETFLQGSYCNDTNVYSESDVDVVIRLDWNIPADNFGGSYKDTFISTFNYIVKADRSTFRCANGIHRLLGDGSPVSWAAANCNAYLESLRDLWNEWQ